MHREEIFNEISVEISGEISTNLIMVFETTTATIKTVTTTTHKTEVFLKTEETEVTEDKTDNITTAAATTENREAAKMIEAHTLELSMRETKWPRCYSGEHHQQL